LFNKKERLIADYLHAEDCGGNAHNDRKSSEEVGMLLLPDFRTSTTQAKLLLHFVCFKHTV